MATNSTSQDGLKWFGEGFDGFPRRLPDDTVEYWIQVVTSPPSNESTTRSVLASVQSAAKDLSKKLLNDYIWQRETFTLQLRRDKVLNTWILYGRTNYGDSVADEWLIVFLLRSLSQQFADIWIRVSDNDGEFLLIEAANALPRWLNPEVAANRVWINSGKLYIIPSEIDSSANGKSTHRSQSISTKEASKFISLLRGKLIHSVLIEEEAFYRIRNYPAQISDSLHNSLVTIPRKLAHVLHHNASYISPAVESFYVRDPISMRPLDDKDGQALHFRAQDFVTTSVKFTKVGFAQLKSQDYNAPASWHSDGLLQETTGKARDAINMGMKLTCAFEMLLNDSQNKGLQSVREIKLLLEDINSGEDKLPDDVVIEGWSKQDDDEAWLDIDFEDLDRELSGGPKGPAGSSGKGFGDKEAEQNLRKMVERFEKFLNDENAGVDGAEDLEDMDFDNDDEEEADEDDDADSSDADSGEDEDASFDETEFTNMMREMMGLPPGRSDAAKQPAKQGLSRALNQVEEIESDDDVDLEDIKKLTSQMEAELKASGALNLNPSTQSRTDPQASKDNPSTDDDDEESSDLNLARNLLESLKAQGGSAGPAEALMGLLGVKMPRDDESRIKK